MDYKKYKLPAGLAVALSLCFFSFFRHASYSASMTIGGILCVGSAIMLIPSIIWRKKLKSKWLLPFVACMFLCALIPFLNDYFKYNNINDKNITDLLIFIVLIIFTQIVCRYNMSILEDEKNKESKKGSYIMHLFIFNIRNIDDIWYAYLQ